MKKIIRLYVYLILLMIPISINAKTIDNFVKGWELDARYVSLTEEEQAQTIVMFTTSTSYENGYIVSYIDEELLYNENKIKTTLGIYSLTGKLIKSTQENYGIVSLATDGKDIYALTIDIENEKNIIIQYNNDLEKIKEIEFEVSEEMYMIYIEGKYFNLSTFQMVNDRLYAMKDENNIVEFDKNLNVIKEHLLDSKSNDICNILPRLCVAMFSENENEDIFGYDRKDKKEVYSGRNETGAFIRLYDNSKEIFTITLPSSEVLTVTNVRFFNDYIIGMAPLNIGYLLCVIDLEGNIIQYIQDGSIINLSINEEDQSISFHHVSEEKSNCPSYMGSQCGKVQFTQYYLGVTKNQNRIYTVLDILGYSTLEKTPSGDYIATGVVPVSQNGEYTYEAIISKFTQTGEELWHKKYVNGSRSSFNDVVSTKEDEYIAVGSDGADAIIVKYDKEANIIWQKKWGGSSGDSFSKILKVDDGYVVSGTTNSTDINGLTNNGSQDGIIVKYDLDGNLIWQKSFGGSGSESFSGLIETNDGGIVLSGGTTSQNISNLTHSSYTYDGIIVKYDQDGNLLWQKIYSMSANYTQFLDIAELKNGNLLVVACNAIGDIASQKRTNVLAKYDKNGNYISSETIPGDELGELNIMLKETEDGGCVALLRITDPDYDIVDTLVKIDSEGEVTDNQILSMDKTGFLLLFDFENAFTNDQVLLGLGIDESIQQAYTEIMFSGNNSVIERPYIAKNKSTNGTYELTQEGELSKIVLSPDKGYVLDKLSITDNEGKEVEYYEKDGAYYFKTSNLLSINVTYKEEVINPNTITFLKLGFIAIIIFAIYNLFISKKLKINRYA